MRIFIYTLGWQVRKEKVNVGVQTELPDSRFVDVPTLRDRVDVQSPKRDVQTQTENLEEKKGVTDNLQEKEEHLTDKLQRNDSLPKTDRVEEEERQVTDRDRVQEEEEEQVTDRDRVQEVKENQQVLKGDQGEKTREEGKEEVPEETGAEQTLLEQIKEETDVEVEEEGNKENLNSEENDNREAQQKQKQLLDESDENSVKENEDKEADDDDEDLLPLLRAIIGRTMQQSLVEVIEEEEQLRKRD